MRNRIWLLAGLLLVAVAVMADEPAPQTETLMTMRVDGEIAIDKEGRVLAYTIATKLQPEIKAVLDKAIPGWVFFPVLIDGKPTAVKTKMRITLGGKPVDNGYKVGIDNVVFRDESVKEEVGAVAPSGVKLSLKSRRPLPEYPRYSVNGHVLVYIRAAPNGDIEEAFAAQSSLFNAKGSEEELAAALKAMEVNAVKAIKRWKLNVDTQGKQPTLADLTETISVVYTMAGSTVTKETAGIWRWENRAPYRDVPWLRDTRLAQRIGVSDVDFGEMMPVASPVRLRDGVIGKAL